MENKNDVISIFNIEKSVKRTSEKCQISEYLVRKILKNNGIILTRSSSHLKYKCNENYFENIDSEDKAYWLGFLFADGYVNKRPGSDRLILALSTKDKKHIELFKKSINSENPIIDSIIKTGIMKGKEYSKISITSNKLISDLENLGCTSKKSLTLKFPNLKKELIPHFIRGYFDGDGSVFLSNEKHWRNGTITPVIHFRFCGTKEFLEVINKEINLSGRISQAKQSKAFELTYKRNKKVIHFYQYLYNNSTIFLHRKHEVFKKHIQERCSETIIS